MNGFNSKITAFLTGEGVLSVSSSTRKHQLKIELYDADGNISQEQFGVAVLMETPDASENVYMGTLHQGAKILMIDGIASEFHFVLDAEFGALPANHSYRVFWYEIS